MRLVSENQKHSEGAESITEADYMDLGFRSILQKKKPENQAFSNYSTMISILRMKDRCGHCERFKLLKLPKSYQLQETLTSLEIEIPGELMQKLSDVSKPDLLFPYSFFIPSMQSMLTGGTQVGNKPASYHKENFIDAAPAGVE